MNDETVTVTIHFVDGGSAEFKKPQQLIVEYHRHLLAGLEGRALVHQILGDDWAAPPKDVTLSFPSSSGIQTIEIAC